MYDRRPGWLTPLKGLIALLLLLLLLARGEGARAQAPERTEAFVYGINAAMPDGVVGTFAPPSVEEIYLMAGRKSILSARRTLVFFWPISNEYRAAWSEMNEELEGTLEVLAGSRLVASLDSVPYTVQFVPGPAGGEAQPTIYVGDEALAAERRFQTERSAHEAEMRAYQAAHEAWLALARLAQEQGTTATLPPAPRQPPPYNVYSAGLHRGHVIELPAGRYTIRTRGADGGIVEGSRRALTVFDARRTAVGYNVIPEARWTFPETLDDPADILLGAPGTTHFLQPRVIREFPRLAYQRLQNPQGGSESGAEWEWVAGEPVEEGTLELRRDGRLLEERQPAPYYVVQVPGGEFGYEIRPHDDAAAAEGRAIDFVAYAITLDERMPALEVRLRGPGGELLAGGSRAIRTAPPASLPPLLLPALLPIALGGALHLWRRRRLAPPRQRGALSPPHTHKGSE